MYKFLSIIPVVFLSSCLFSNNIIVDEDEGGNTVKNKENNIVKVDEIKDDNIKVISERKIITRDDKDFVIEDIDSKDFNLDYSLTGLSKFSSKEAIDAIKKLKKENSDIKFVVYFEFNSSELSEESKNIINYNNEFYKKNPNLKLTLNGHTDIKGSREYNLSLGEQRALAVKKMMQGNIDIISFGEEKTISNIDSKNRRVEFVYK